MKKFIPYREILWEWKIFLYSIYFRLILLLFKQLNCLYD